MKPAVYEIGWIRGPSRPSKNKRYLKMEIVVSACTRHTELLLLKTQAVQIAMRNCADKEIPLELNWNMDSFLGMDLLLY
jgi:hypothetical protein